MERAKERGLAGGAKGEFSAKTNDTGSVELPKVNFQAPARRSCDVMDFGPLLGVKGEYGVFKEVFSNIM